MLMNPSCYGAFRPTPSPPTTASGCSRPPLCERRRAAENALAAAADGCAVPVGRCSIGTSVIQQNGYTTSCISIYIYIIFIYTYNIYLYHKHMYMYLYMLCIAAIIAERCEESKCSTSDPRGSPFGAGDPIQASQHRGTRQQLFLVDAS